MSDAMLITNGRIYTMDRAGTVVDALVIRDGRIAFAGARSSINLADSEPVIDAGGAAVLPGLIDGHAHLLGLAGARLSLDVGIAASEADAAALVRRAAAAAPPGDWITGRGWDQNRWLGGRFPSRASLDQAAPAHPVALGRVDGHALWVNSAALHAAGVTRDTADPAGGLIVRDHGGAPSGLLIDTAQRLVYRVQPRPSPARFDRAVRAAIDECLAKGLTGVHEMGVDLEGIASYRRLIEQGSFPFRNYAAVAASSDETWRRYIETGPEMIGDGRLVIGAVKLIADGALGSRGAALHQPYDDDPGNRGLLLLEPGELAHRTRLAAARGFQVCIHAIGDRANSLVLDTFEQAIREGVLPPDHRCRIEHAQILTERDLPRFRQLGVLPSMQPSHCTSDMPWAAARLGQDRLRLAYAWRSLLVSGVVIAGGSDFPVEDCNPFLGIAAAVTRRPPGAPAVSDRGAAPPPVNSGGAIDQRMTREEAVRSFTSWNAHAAFQEAELGSLEAGKRADLVILTDDPFTCPEDAIAAIVPRLTMVGGEIVYRR